MEILNYCAFVMTMASWSFQSALNKRVMPDISIKGQEYSSWLENIIEIFSKPDEEQEEELVPMDLNKCAPCECGVSRKTSKIVGGSAVKLVNEYPWMVQLYYKSKFYCGGSLINSKYVLTAAHCVHHFDKKLITVRLLEHDRSTSNESQHITRKVNRIAKHKGYNSGNFNNDIALIRLDEEVPLGRRTNQPMPVCLPPEDKSFTGSQALVAGWGTTKAGGSTAQVIQEVIVSIISNEACKKTGYGERRITPNMMCAGDKDGGKDSCQGDSGGPLKIGSRGNYIQVGIVSWGEGCGEKNYPGVYTRVNRYLNWMKNNTADSCPCHHNTEME